MQRNSGTNEERANRDLLVWENYKAIRKSSRLQRTAVNATNCKWWQHETAVSLPSWPKWLRVQWRLRHDAAKQPHSSIQTDAVRMHVSLPSVKVKVHDSVLREKWNHCWVKDTRKIRVCQKTLSICPRLLGKHCGLTRQTYNFLRGFGSKYKWHQTVMAMVSNSGYSVMVLWERNHQFCTLSICRAEAEASPALKRNRMRGVEWPAQSLAEMLSCDPKDPLMWLKNNRAAKYERTELPLQRTIDVIGPLWLWRFYCC